MNNPNQPPQYRLAGLLHLPKGLLRYAQFLTGLLLVIAILSYSPSQVQARIQTLSPTAPQTTQVNMQNFAFLPALVVIQAGESVTWTNQDDLVIHTTTSDTAGWNSGDLATGESFSHTFATPGRYDYHCNYHSLSMLATVIVVKPQIYLPILFD